MADYARIYATVRAVLDGVQAHTTEACIFFSLAGAYLLEKYHKISARPMAGAAFFGLGGNPPNVLSFARFEENVAVSDHTAFHCWVDCGDWAIDFMAPIFPEKARRQNIQVSVPSKMFQRPFATMADHVDLQSMGDFLMIPNPGLTAELLTSTLAKPTTGDLANICGDWYRPAKKKMKPTLTMGSDDGTIRTLRLPSVSLTGAW